jgi:hypothetical protein
MSQRTDRSRDAEAPPQSAIEALDRVQRHARAAFGEAALAARALFDAASLASTGVPADAHGALAGAGSWLGGLAERALDGTTRGTPSWLEAVAGALDQEIQRWEALGRDDPEARAVLRAFLGVREVLWEFGLRPTRSASDAGERPGDARGAARGAREPRGGGAPSRPRTARTSASRLQRVPIEG